MKDSEVLILRCPPPFYPQLASRSLLSVALLGCLPSLDAAVGVMRLHGLFFGTEKNTAGTKKAVINGVALGCNLKDICTKIAPASVCATVAVTPDAEKYATCFLLVMFVSLGVSIFMNSQQYIDSFSFIALTPTASKLFGFCIYDFYSIQGGKTRKDTILVVCLFSTCRYIYLLACSCYGNIKH